MTVATFLMSMPRAATAVVMRMGDLPETKARMASSLSCWVLLLLDVSIASGMVSTVAYLCINVVGKPPLNRKSSRFSTPRTALQKMMVNPGSMLYSRS